MVGAVVSVRWKALSRIINVIIKGSKWNLPKLFDRDNVDVQDVLKYNFYNG